MYINNEAEEKHLLSAIAFFFFFFAFSHIDLAFYDLWLQFNWHSLNDFLLGKRVTEPSLFVPVSGHSWLVAELRVSMRARSEGGPQRCCR